MKSTFSIIFLWFSYGFPINQLRLLMLDAVMRLAAGEAPDASTRFRATAGRMELLAPWAPQLGSNWAWRQTSFDG